MSNALPDGKRIRIRSFYGFNPEEAGYVGWTKETDRDAYLRKLNDGDLIMIYGASTSETRKAERSYVLGFLEVEARAIRDTDKSSDLALREKRERGWEDRWTYAIPVRRAWRAEERMMIGRIAINSYRSEAGQALAVHGAELDEEEITRALKIRVREVSVFGEAPLAESAEQPTPFEEVFKPSRAFPGSHGERIADHKDGDTFLYLAIYEGDGHALLGKPKPFGDKTVALKIGVTNNMRGRFKRLNCGIPPAAKGKWKELLVSPAFPTKADAETVEAMFKDQSAGRGLESLGGEFFWGKSDDAQSLFWSLPGVSRF